MDIRSTLQEVPRHATATGATRRRVWTGLACSAVAMAAVATQGPVAAKGAADLAASQQAHGVFRQVNLVSDLPGMGARIIDPLVKNPWGIAFGYGDNATPLWVTNQFSTTGTGSITLYAGANGSDPFVKIPLDIDASSPTGMVFNDTDSFVISQGGERSPARFLFNEVFFGPSGSTGKITGWSPVPSPVTHTTPTAAVQPGGFPTGLALVPGARSRGDRLLVSDVATGLVTVYNPRFHRIRMPAGAFTDPRAAARGLVPYNVMYMKGKVYVAYTAQPGVRGGAVTVFRPNGTLHKRLIPFTERLFGAWGMAIAPRHWNGFGSALLVGNVDDGRINAFSQRDGHFRGTLRDEQRRPLVNLGLWGIAFGNGVIGTPRTLIFAAGIGDEVDEHVYEHGLVGLIKPAPRR